MRFAMSEELNDFSEQIDEHFDIPDTERAESDDFWEALVNLFI
jgi:RNAse (barnase) inhibitor barstar